MESGLEGRNNADHEGSRFEALLVSMKSGLEGRNNDAVPRTVADPLTSQ